MSSLSHLRYQVNTDHKKEEISKITLGDNRDSHKATKEVSTLEVKLRDHVKMEASNHPVLL